MKILKIYSPFLLLIIALGFNSCKKKCVVDSEDIDSGSITKDVIFYPESGYMTSNMGGNYVINASHPYADRIEVSINGGDKSPVNYMNYTVLCYPVVANCNAKYERTVTIDNTNQTVIYKIVVTQCTDCKEKRTTENYVLVPAFPSSHEVFFDVSYIDK